MPSNLTDKDFVCISYVQPFTLNDIKISCDHFETKLKELKAFVDRRVLCQSFEGRPCEIITVTDSDFQKAENRDYDKKDIVYPNDKEPCI